jgi:hypothetical protein
MARTLHIDGPAAAAYPRNAAGAEAAGNLAANAILGLLALIGKPVTAAASGIRRAYASWSAARRQRIEDEKLWSLALPDARIMADLSRAMSRDALRDTRGYY